MGTWKSVIGGKHPKMEVSSFPTMQELKSWTQVPIFQDFIRKWYKLQKSFLEHNLKKNDVPKKHNFWKLFY